MQRDLDAFTGIFDVLVVGGGIYGACIARLAAQSGWSVALLERDDFGAAVSHNSLKIVHGGFRYVQHLDLPRIRESVAAQRAWLTAAPHLVRPLRCVVPTYGYGSRGPLAFGAGICAYHALAGRRNKGMRPESHLPRSGLLNRRELLSRHPDLDRHDVTGGAYWFDAQMLDANRLTLECVQDAYAHGAVVANHASVLGFRETKDRIEGVVAHDSLSGREFEVRARMTVNATGPFVEYLLGTSATKLSFPQPLVWTRNVNIVTRNLFESEDAVGIGSQRASDAAIGSSKRLFFVAPWQDCSLIGTSHVKHHGGTNDLSAAVKNDFEGFLSEFNETLPNRRVEVDDVRYVHSGLTPAEDGVERSKRSSIIDHSSLDRVHGLVSVLGIKYTTAPIVAADVIKVIARSLNGMPENSSQFSAPLPGNKLHTGSTFRPDSVAFASHDERWANQIYSSNAQNMMRMVKQIDLSPAEHIFRCRILYGIRNEMVIRLRDAVFRATDLAERGRLTNDHLSWCADTMSKEFGWDPMRREAEVNDVRTRLDKSFSSNLDSSCRGPV